MNEVLYWIGHNLSLYWGEGIYHILFFFSYVYLLVKRKHSDCLGPTLLYAFLAFALFAFPYTAWFIGNCIGDSVYWRVLWLCPTLPVIAIAISDIIGSQKIACKLVFAAVAFLLIAFGGKSMTEAGNYSIVNNYQQVPDDVAQVCSMIRQQAGEEEVVLATDDYMASYVRVYDPSIKMLYGRMGKGTRRNASKVLYQEVCKASDFGYIARLARKLNCTHLALSVPGQEQRELILEEGWKLIGNVDGYDIYSLKKRYRK